MQEGHDVGRVADARTMSAMVKLTQEIDESCVYVVGYGMVSLLSPRPADCGMPVDGVESWLHEDSSDPRRADQKTPRSIMYDMMSLMTSSRDKLWRAMLQCSL